MLSRIARLIERPQLPRRTVRLRLTVLYGILFLASGAALLTITYALVRHSTANVVLFRGDSGPPTRVDLDALRVVDPDRLRADLERLDDLDPDQLERSLQVRPIPEELQGLMRDRRAQAAGQRNEQLRQLLIQSGIALGLMAVVSIGLGWLMAGRVLRPLRTMTAATHRISEHNLHERLALEGPSDELKDLGDTIDGLLGRLEAAFEAQRRFVANASHELRTPLAMMRTSLDVAAGKPEAESPQASALDSKLREGLDRADRLLEDFLTLARAQHGAGLKRATVSLPELVRAVIEERADALAEGGIEVDKDLHEADVTGSRTLLSHMIENLIDNAIRHNQASGSLRVETRGEGDCARLSVENGGPPLDPDTVAELAQPFRRAGAERIRSGNGAGVGLGLSIVAAIAAAHDGELELRPCPGGGLRATVELPRGSRIPPAGEPA